MSHHNTGADIFWTTILVDMFNYWDAYGNNPEDEEESLARIKVCR